VPPWRYDFNTAEWRRLVTYGSAFDGAPPPMSTWGTLLGSPVLLRQLYARRMVGHGCEAEEGHGIVATVFQAVAAVTLSPSAVGANANGPLMAWMSHCGDEAVHGGSDAAGGAFAFDVDTQTWRGVVDHGDSVVATDGGAPTGAHPAARSFAAAAAVVTSTLQREIAATTVWAYGGGDARGAVLDDLWRLQLGPRDLRPGLTV
jgi:hypothetical protein